MSDNKVFPKADLSDGSSLVFFHAPASVGLPLGINEFPQTPDSSGDIYTRFDSNGNATGSPYVINETTHHTQHYPDILMYKGGEGFVVAWAQSQGGSSFAAAYQRFKGF